MTTDPVMAKASVSPNDVSCGDSAFFSACRMMTASSASPFARASLMYSVSRISSIDERINRVRNGSARNVSTATGST